MSNQNSIVAADVEAAELDATRAVYEMLTPLGCEAQTRVLDHVYNLLRAARQRQWSGAQERKEISEARGNTTKNNRVGKLRGPNTPPRQLAAQPITRRYIWS